MLKKIINYGLRQINLFKRLNEVEYRHFNRRFYAILQLNEYLLSADLNGDYLEFGVWEGTTFISAYKQMSPIHKNMRFIAFDSFEGLPGIKNIDAENGYTSKFYKGQFNCTEKNFIKRLKKKGVDLNKVLTVPGWFNNTLNKETQEKLNLKTVGAAYIDCDLYESTIPVLDFLTPILTTGSVLLFDDWRCYRNHPDYGEQKACREWLEKNPHIKLNHLFDYGWNGIAFTVILR